MRVILNIVVIDLFIRQMPSVCCEDISFHAEKVKAEWGFSPVVTIDLAGFELGIYQSALDYQKSLQQRLSLLDTWIKDYEDSTNQSTHLQVELNTKELDWQVAGEISAHPLMTFRMMRRFTNYLAKIFSQSFSDEADASFLERIEEWDTNTMGSLPTPSDIPNVTTSIIRLQQVYDLRAGDLITGIIANKTTLVGLTPLQAFEIGKQAKDNKVYPQALDWFRVVQNEIQKHPNKDVEPSEVADNIRQLILEHDALHDRINDKNFYDLNLNRFQAKIVSEDELETVKAYQNKMLSKTKTFGKNNSAFAFSLLCNRQDFRSETEKAKLYCWYETKSHLVWTINPLKIEVHSWDPYVIRIYDVVGEKILEYLIYTASLELERSEVVQYTKDDSVEDAISAVRTSSQTFIFEHEHPPLRNLEKLIETMTGLQVENTMYNLSDYQVSEPIQVAAYTFGGHFTEHNDAFGQISWDTPQGDRVATFMIYLNDVELGGYTAFPKIGIAISPVKGSAVFWYDLWKNGTVDSRNLHGGCPVIFGQKWIGNKWIHYNANFQKRMCSLSRLE